MAKKYKTIVVDPPWKYGKWGKASDSPLARKKFPNGQWEKDFEIPYNTMSVEEIKALKVAELADENCDLYLWTTQKYLPDAFEVLKAWGFKYCQTLTWCKTPRGTGQGGVYCPTTEFLLLGRKGKAPKTKRVDTTWWNIKRTANHSKKPEYFQDLIETVSDSPRLEMFARRERKNWDILGNEVNSDINFNGLEQTEAGRAFLKISTSNQQSNETMLQALNLPPVSKRIEPVGEGSVCGDCWGSGWEQQFIEPCKKCNGTGKI